MENGIKALIATDFSPCAENALRYGVHFVSRFKSEVLILNVYKLLKDTVGSDYESLKKQEERLRTDSLTKTEEGCAYIKQNFKDIHCRPLTAEGFAYRGISDTAEENDTDLVVLGARDRNIIERFLHGNMTKKIIEHVKCPVLVVPQNASFTGINNIVYGCNLSDAEIGKINQLSVVAKAFDAKLTVVNISAGIKGKERLDDFRRRTAEVVSYDNMDWVPVEGKDIIKSLHNSVSETQADLLVISAHTPVTMERLYRDSITEEMLNKLTLPLLVFHLDIEDE